MKLVSYVFLRQLTLPRYPDFFVVTFRTRHLFFNAVWIGGAIVGVQALELVSLVLKRLHPLSHLLSRLWNGSLGTDSLLGSETLTTFFFTNSSSTYPPSIKTISFFSVFIDGGYDKKNLEWRKKESQGTIFNRKIALYWWWIILCSGSSYEWKRYGIYRYRYIIFYPPIRERFL